MGPRFDPFRARNEQTPQNRRDQSTSFMNHGLGSVSNGGIATEKADGKGESGIRTFERVGQLNIEQTYDGVRRRIYPLPVPS